MEPYYIAFHFSDFQRILGGFVPVCTHPFEIAGLCGCNLGCGADSYASTARSAHSTGNARVSVSSGSRIHPEWRGHRTFSTNGKGRIMRVAGYAFITTIKIVSNGIGRCELKGKRFPSYVTMFLLPILLLKCLKRGCKKGEVGGWPSSKGRRGSMVVVGGGRRGVFFPREGAQPAHHTH